jgi:lysophospholipase L1-like esterase
MLGYCANCCWSNWTLTNPDAITLHIGTNDIGDCFTGGGPLKSKKNTTECVGYLQQQLKRLLDFLFKELPHTHVFLATIIAMPQYSFYNATVADYNSQVIPAMIQR